MGEGWGEVTLKLGEENRVDNYFNIILDLQSKCNKPGLDVVNQVVNETVDG